MKIALYIRIYIQKADVVSKFCKYRVMIQRERDDIASESSITKANDSTALLWKFTEFRDNETNWWFWFLQEKGQRNSVYKVVQKTEKNGKRQKISQIYEVNWYLRLTYTNIHANIHLTVSYSHFFWVLTFSRNSIQRTGEGTDSEKWGTLVIVLYGLTVGQAPIELHVKRHWRRGGRNKLLPKGPASTPVEGERVEKGDI